MKWKSKILCFTLVVVGFLLVVFNASIVRAEVNPGEVIDKSNWEKAKELLPDCIPLMIKDQGMKIPVEESKTYNLSPKYLEASKKYEGTCKVEDMMGYIAGQPFPKIDPKDPQAGIKLAWNMQYSYFPEYAYRPAIGFYFMPKNGDLERKPKCSDWKLMYVNRNLIPPTPTLPNPDKVISKEIMQFFDPKDCAGIGFLDIKYMSEKKDNDSWAYVPSLRRVKRMSGAMRTDAYLGSDYTIEDFYGFQGKVTEFTWKMIGETKALAMFDIDSPAFYINNPDVIDGSKPKPWKYTWYPIDLKYSLRDNWIVEHTPKSPSHPYSKRVMWIDKQWYCYNHVLYYDKQGQLWKNGINGTMWIPKDKIFLNQSTWLHDWQNNHGTLTIGRCIMPTSSPEKDKPTFYVIDTLEKYGH